MDEYREEDLPSDAIEEEAAKHENHRYHSIEVLCLMLATMYSKLQKSYENLGAYEMNEKLRDMFQEQARTERLKVMQYSRLQAIG